MGMPQIEVTFNIDANGILNVTARDKGTGKEQTIKIESSGGLSKDEIERMKRDAESHAAEDKQKRELAEARNTAEQRVYQLEKLIEENKDKLSDSDKSALRAAIEKVNEAKKGDDAAAINRAIDELQRASQAMAEHLYSAAGGSRRRRGPGRRGRPASPDGGEATSPKTSSTSNSRRRSDAPSGQNPERRSTSQVSEADDDSELLSSCCNRPALEGDHGIPLRSADAQEPGGRAGGTVAGARARAPAARADAPAGGAPRPRAAGHPLAPGTSSASIPPRSRRPPRRG